MQRPQSLSRSIPSNSQRPRLVLRTLGVFGLFGDGATPLLGPSKPLALLAYLHATPGRAVARDHLLHMFWSDVDESAARHTLRQTAYYLRQHLGGDFLATRAGFVELVAPLQSDRSLFIEAVETGELDSAVAIYGGDYLAGFVAPGALEFEHWAEVERQQLRLRFLRAAEQLARARLNEGRFRDARELTTRMRSVGALDETAWRLQIQAALSGGDRVTAFADVSQLMDLLAAEEREPEPATRLLLKQVRLNAPSTDEGSGRELVAELVGRERQFAQLVSAYRRSLAGAAQPVVVAAPAGLGKTRLLRDFARYVAADGTRTLYLRAQPVDRDVPWSYAAAFVRPLAAMPGAAGVSPAAASSLIAVNPTVASHWPGVAADRADSAEVFRNRLTAIEDLLRAVCEERHLTVLLDDWHWVDDTSRDLIRRIITRAADIQALFVVAQRPAAHLARPDPSDALSLQPLDRDQVGSFVASLGTLPTGAWVDGLSTQLLDATGGSPLLILETLRLALDKQALALEEGQWRCSNPNALQDLLISGSALSRRIGELDPAQVALLRLLACAGGAVSEAHLFAAAGADSERTHAVHLTALEQRGLVMKTECNWSTSHDEISDATLSAATPEQLRAAHSALGLAMAAGGGASAARAAARHLVAAGLDGPLHRLAAATVGRAREERDHRTVTQVVADLLGTHVDDKRVSAVKASLPLRLRYTRRLWFAASATAFALLLIFLNTLRAPLNNRMSAVTIVNWRMEGGNAWRAYTHSLTEQAVSDGVLPLSSFRRTALLSPDRASGAVSPANPNLLASTRTFADSGGEEIVFVSATSGSQTRITYQKGDDVFGDWSPDGRSLVIYTDRWSERSMSDIAIVDVASQGSAVIRLTSDPRSRDTEPVWSPDGSRIAFFRSFFSRITTEDERHKICVVTVNAAREVCLAVPGLFANGFGGWVSAVEIAGVFRDSTGRSRVLVVNTETGASYDVAEGNVRWGQTSARGWLLCYCRRTVAEPYGTLLVNTQRPEQALRIEPGDPPPELALLVPSGSRSHIAHIKINLPTMALPSHGEHRAYARGWDASGRPVEPLALQWHSSDASVATVDSTGLIRPQRAGTATVTVTSGGWVSDSVAVVFGNADEFTFVQERWRRGLDSSWVPFGNPRPFLVRDGRGHSISVNGDSSFTSGFYLRQAVSPRDGVGVELHLSAKITSVDWQMFDVMFVTSDSVDLDTWDHRTGELPLLRNARWRGCGAHYPRTLRNDQLEMTDGLRTSGPVPARLAAGDWTRLRLQIFPDGRCGVAVNGRAVVVGERRVALGSHVMLVLHGYSHRTTMRVGALDVWRGVRQDVDWRSTQSEREPLRSQVGARPRPRVNTGVGR